MESDLLRHESLLFLDSVGISLDCLFGLTIKIRNQLIELD